MDGVARQWLPLPAAPCRCPLPPCPTSATLLDSQAPRYVLSWGKTQAGDVCNEQADIVRDGIGWVQAFHQMPGRFPLTIDAGSAREVREVRHHGTSRLKHERVVTRGTEILTTRSCIPAQDAFRRLGERVQHTSSLSP